MFVTLLQIQKTHFFAIDFKSEFHYQSIIITLTIYLSSLDKKKTYLRTFALRVVYKHCALRMAGVLVPRYLIA